MTLIFRKKHTFIIDIRSSYYVYYNSIMIINQNRKHFWTRLKKSETSSLLVHDKIETGNICVIIAFNSKSYRKGNNLEQLSIAAW